MSAAIPIEEIKIIKLSVYRFDPTMDKKPYMQSLDIEVPANKDLMVFFRFVR